MILTALYQHYQTLKELNTVPVPGWETGRVSFALRLDGDGKLLDLMPTTETDTTGKKPVTRPLGMRLPLGVKRTVGVAANFLWDNATYLLGIPKRDPKRDLLCFQSSAELHRRLLEPVDHPAAQAVCRFFAEWKPEQAAEHPVLLPYLEELKKGGNLVFRVDGIFLHEVPAVQAAWDKEYNKPPADAALAQCLITGERAPIARLHPAIKGVRGGQPTGTALVSFNAPAFLSYGKEQNYNAPVSEDAAFAYTTALNALLADKEHCLLLGDTTVVYWPGAAEPAYADFFTAALDPGRNQAFPEADLARGMEAIRQGRPFPFGDAELFPDTDFFILGLAPNAARLSVRFFYRSTFGALGSNLLEHYRRLEILRPPKAQPYLSPWAMLRETANQNAKEKEPPSTLLGAVMRAILENGPYPATLFSTVLLRIRADHDINWQRAAILKAWFLQNRKDKSHYKEAATVKLNEDTNYLPYLLGRLFSLLENIQDAATPGLNATIKDRYFNSASATPAAVFPLLLRLEQNHMKVLKRDKTGLAITLDRQLREIMGRINETFPVHMNQEDQGTFVLGYYHQTQKRYQKEEEKDNG